MIINITKIGQGLLIAWLDGRIEYLTDFEVEERKIAAKEVA